MERKIVKGVRRCDGLGGIWYGMMKGWNGLGKE